MTNVRNRSGTAVPPHEGARNGLRLPVFEPRACFGALLAAATLAGYVAGFDTLHRVMGTVAGAFGFVPVLIAGALYGQAAGALAGVILVPINVMLYRTAGSGLVSWANHVVPGLTALFAGAVVGRLRDLGALLVDKQKQLEGALAQLSLAREVTAQDTTERREHVAALQVANAGLAAAQAAVPATPALGS
jgi:hypothetical protein